MAQVDFSNARIEPYDTWGGYPLKNPTFNANLGLNYGGGNSNLFNINDQVISSSFTCTQLINQQKQLMYLYQGTFSASGTEFYIKGDTVVWKVSNISFSNGDTFVFQINATLVCN